MKKLILVASFLIIVFLSLPHINAQNIFEAVRTGKIDIVKLLIKQNPKLVNSRTDTWKETPLHIAVEEGRSGKAPVPFFPFFLRR